MLGAVHRGYLDQAIAFRREQSNGGEAQRRGRRRSAAEQRQLERENRQKEAAFSVYFNGANNEDKADAGKRRQSATRRDHTTPPLPLALHGSSVAEWDEAAEERRQVRRRQSKEVTGKITEQPPRASSFSSTFASPLSSPHSQERREDEAKLLSPQSSSPYDSPPSVSSPSFVIAPLQARGSVSDGRRRRRTWGSSAVAVKTMDGDLVHIQPRRLDWEDDGLQHKTPQQSAEGGRAWRGAEGRDHRLWAGHGGGHLR